MVFAYLTLIFIVLGIFLWLVAGVVDKRGKLLRGKSRQKYQKIANYIGTAAKTSLLLAAAAFVIAVMLLQAVES